MSSFQKAIDLLQLCDTQWDNTVKNLHRKIDKLEKELEAPRLGHSKVADQGKIIERQAAEIRMLKGASKRQSAIINQAKAAFR